jgi:hypothetical protein
MKGHLRETLIFSMIRASNWDCLKIGDTRENSNGENENHPLEVGSGGTLFFSQTNLRFLPHSPSKKTIHAIHVVMIQHSYENTKKQTASFQTFPSYHPSEYHPLTISSINPVLSVDCCLISSTHHYSVDRLTLHQPILQPSTSKWTIYP